MSTIPQDLLYSETHEWIRIDDQNIITLGMSDHAQMLLGDVVYIELPEVNDEINSGDDLGVIESVKAASDVYSPVDGTIIEINEQLLESPSMLNHDPYQSGWICKIQLHNRDELDSLMHAEDYQMTIEHGDGDSDTE